MYTIEQVNEGLKKVIDYLNETKDVWNQTRKLKLYPTFYEYENIINEYPAVAKTYNANDLFYWFCDDQYDQFTDWMNENNIDDCRCYIGRTSSFYLTDIHSDDMDTVIYTLLDKTLNGLSYLDIENGKANLYESDYYSKEEILDYAQPEMEYIANDEFLQDIKKYLSDAINIADYIDDFMEHQLDYFKDYIEDRSIEADTLEYHEEQQEKAFIDKYANAIFDMTESIEGFMKETGCTLQDVRKVFNKAMETCEA